MLRITIKAFKRLLRGLLMLVCLLSTALAQQIEEVATAPAASSQSVAEQLQQLKKEVIALNRDLFVLEEDLLFPSSTQLVVYLSMDVGQYFNLDSVEVKLDGVSVTHYLYTEKQQQALLKGGVQKLHLANLAQGQHEISAFFIGQGPHEREYRRATSLTFNKSADTKVLELRIVDDTATQQPEFKVIEL